MLKKSKARRTAAAGSQELTHLKEVYKKIWKFQSFYICLVFSSPEISINPGFETIIALSLVRTPVEAFLEGVIPASERYESVSKLSARLESVITLEKTSNSVDVPGHLVNSHQIALFIICPLLSNILFS